MRPEQRVVVTIPVDELWNQAGPLHATRERDLATADLRVLLRAGPLRFVIAELGLPLRWLDPSACFTFWKTELQDHLCSGAAFYLEDYPGQRCFTASKWRLPSGETIVLLETHE